MITIAMALLLTAQTASAAQEPKPAPASQSVLTSYILGGAVHPLLRDGVPDRDRCETDQAKPDECRLLQPDNTEAIAGDGGWLMQDADPYDLPESQLAFRKTVVGIAKDGTRLGSFSNTEVCGNGLTQAMDGCAKTDGVFPLVRLNRRVLDTRIVTFDPRRAELSWPTKQGPFILHLGSQSATHVAKAMETPPNVFTVDLIVTMPRPTARGYEATIVQETRKLTDHWSSDKPEGSPPDPLSYLVKPPEPAFAGPKASCPGVLEGGWRPASGSRYDVSTFYFRCGTVGYSPSLCPGCSAQTDMESRYDVVGDILTITYLGRTRTTSRGDMHPPNTPDDVDEKTMPVKTQRYRILERCPEGPIDDPKVMRHLDSPRCLVMESE